MELFFLFFVTFIAFPQTGLFVMRKILFKPVREFDRPLGPNTYMMLPVETQRLDRMEGARLASAGSLRSCTSQKDATPVDIC